jgi:hydroxyacylglutathione hydrolase
METTSHLSLHQLQLGDYDNFVYILADPETKDAVVIDPAWDVPAILALLAEQGLTVRAVWLTHGHADHTEGVPALVQATGVPVYIAQTMPEKWRPEGVTLVEFDDGDMLSVGAISFEVLSTPGHSPDGSCFLHRNHLIAGDTLFIDGCGRCDLPDSDVDAMYHSLHTRLAALPGNTIIYPGHDYGPLTYDTLANQKRTNRFLRATAHADFVRARMGT